MNSILRSVVGHHQQKLQLQAAFSAIDQGQTWLFTGPSGIGKRRIAQGLAQNLLCQNPRTSSDHAFNPNSVQSVVSKIEACGECGSCHRVSEWQHESLMLVQAEGAQIKIEQARSILEFLSLRSLTSKRVIVIDEAHRMNAQTSNALLKILEEPPQGTVFILISSSLSAILPTIRSRSRRVAFHPLREDELKAIQTAPEWMIRAARGRIEKLQALEDSAEQEVRQNAFLALREFISNPDFFTTSNWRDYFRDRAQAQSIWQYWLLILRDARILQLQGQNSKSMMINSDQMALLHTLTQVSPEQLQKLASYLIQWESEANINRDPILAVEEAAVPFRS